MDKKTKLDNFVEIQSYEHFVLPSSYFFPDDSTARPRQRRVFFFAFFLVEKNKPGGCYEKFNRALTLTDGLEKSREEQKGEAPPSVGEKKYKIK